jgi:spore maturation protein CgeB
MSLLIVGNPAETHVGAHLRRAAAACGLDAHLLDVSAAFDAPAWRRRWDWWARGRRPSRLRTFGDAVVARAAELRPRHLLATGIAPLDRRTLEALGRLGVVRMNYLTDDPWNPSHRAPWFLEALPAYDRIFSPRQANLEDLRALRGPAVSYLPFAYAPEVHFPEALSDADRARFADDVFFAGGADPDRVPVVAALARAGLRVGLYGGYWERYTREVTSRGLLDASGLRRATGGAKVCLCLVRRANRDGHSMRTFEIPAMGGCVLAEDTEDHRHLFGEEGGAAAYFSTPEEAVDQARALVADASRRQRLAGRGHALITGGHHTYADRLTAALALAS